MHQRREEGSMMDDAHSWQSRAVEQLSQLFEGDPDARALVLTGSLADAEVEADAWSDVDMKVVLADRSVDRYYRSLAWLQPFGQLVGMERHEGQAAKTLRVCLDGFKRFDLVFVPQSALHSSSSKNYNLFSQPYAVIWSRLPRLGAQIASLSSPAGHPDISDIEIERLADQFWFKAAATIAKVVRNDLLIGFHLALDLTRDCLVLQMLRRDREMGTQVHRIGGWGNELVDRFFEEGQGGSPLRILNLITQSCETFDDLASRLSSSYTPRGPFLLSAIESAREACRERVGP
jgi:hypothetical protein